MSKANQRTKKIWDTPLRQSVQSHLDNFSLIWIGLAVLLVAAIPALFNCWWLTRLFLFVGLVLIFLLMLCFPMNTVYGLIGTRGSIRVFFLALIVINLVFSCIYYFGFYRKAGICYEVNQPHVSFDYNPQNPQVSEPFHRDTIYLHGLTSDNGLPYFVMEERHQYQRISYGKVIRNTIMTSLMQEPTDLFAATAVFNEANYVDNEVQKRIDESRSNYFHWILILQILISWILLGVFISILYNKFRYES